LTIPVPFILLGLRQFQYGAEAFVVHDGALVNDGQLVEDLIGQRPDAVLKGQCAVRVVINFDFLVGDACVFLCGFNKINYLIVLKCTGSSTVYASFTSPFGKKSDNIRDDIIGEYSINGSSPNKYSMRKDVPVTINPRIVLSSNGVVTGGAFYGFGVLKINYE
jgi:hypothetical protein